MITAPTTTYDTLARPLRDLRISVTDRCNLRCPYCMPADVFAEEYRFQPRSALLTFEEIEHITRLFVELGTTKVRLTGGEPLLRQGLVLLVARLASIDGVRDVALTTNGILLAAQAEALVSAGLQRVTISLDSLRPQTFAELAGRTQHGPGLVLEAIAAAERAGLSPIKINCVVVRDVNEDDIVAIAERFRGSGHIVRFIEYMDVGTRNRWRRQDVVTADEILERIDGVFPLEALPPRYPGEVARRYRYRDGGGEIGVIAPVTQPFCGTCTRARLSSDGRLITCLFAADGIDLKTPLRAGASDDELRAQIASCWRTRTDRYSELRAHEDGNETTRKRVEMFEVGG